MRASSLLFLLFKKKIIFNYSSVEIFFVAFCVCGMCVMVKIKQKKLYYF